MGLRVDLDGREIFRRLAPDSDGGEPEGLPRSFCVIRHALPSGRHELRVETTYRGEGVGVFSYLRGYTFRARGVAQIDLPADAVGVRVISVASESGDLTTPIEERPHIQFTVALEHADANAGCHP